MASWISSFLKLSSYVHPYLKSSKTLSWYLELSRHPTHPLSLFIASASNRWPYDLSTPTPTPTPHCKSYFFGSPSGLCTALGLVGSMSPLPPFFGQWRQQNHVCVFFKGRVSLSDLLFSSRWGKEADFVPNSPCLTPTCVRDNVKTLKVFCFFPPHVNS